MDIVPFTADRASAVAALILAIQRDEFGIAITLRDQPDLADISGFYQSGAGQFWVAIDDGDVVGTIALRDIGDGLGALRKMFVAAAYRGSRHGTAARLLRALLDHAKERQLRAVYLGTTARFLAAHRFYEKYGFEAVTAAELPAAFPRMAVDTKFYRLTLGRACS